MFTYRHESSTFTYRHESSTFIYIHESCKLHKISFLKGENKKRKENSERQNM